MGALNPSPSPAPGRANAGDKITAAMVSEVPPFACFLGFLVVPGQTLESGFYQRILNRIGALAQVVGCATAARRLWAVASGPPWVSVGSSK